MTGDKSASELGDEEPQRSGVRWVMLAVLAWGCVLALGTYLFGGNQPLLRAEIVLACTFGFLALWLLALWSRHGRAGGGKAS